jgi:hypothetical protein
MALASRAGDDGTDWRPTVWGTDSCMALASRAGDDGTDWRPTVWGTAGSGDPRRTWNRGRRGLETRAELGIARPRRHGLETYALGDGEVWRPAPNFQRLNIGMLFLARSLPPEEVSDAASVNGSSRLPIAFGLLQAVVEMKVNDQRKRVGGLASEPGVNDPRVANLERTAYERLVERNDRPVRGE